MRIRSIFTQSVTFHTERRNDSLLVRRVPTTREVRGIETLSTGDESNLEGIGGVSGAESEAASGSCLEGGGRADHEDGRWRGVHVAGIEDGRFGAAFATATHETGRGERS